MKNEEHYWIKYDLSKDKIKPIYEAKSIICDTKEEVNMVLIKLLNNKRAHHIVIDKTYTFD